jgi:hypothetical protein
MLAAEKVQLLPASLRSLPPPSPTQLAALAKQLDAGADAVEQRAVQQRTGRGRAMLKDEDRQQREWFTCAGLPHGT